MTQRSTSAGIQPTGDHNIDQIQSDLSLQIDSLTLASFGTLVSVSLDGTASGTATLDTTNYIVVSKDAAAHIYTLSGRTVRSDAAVNAVLLVF